MKHPPISPSSRIFLMKRLNAHTALDLLLKISHKWEIFGKLLTVSLDLPIVQAKRKTNTKLVTPNFSPFYGHWTVNQTSKSQHCWVYIFVLIFVIFFIFNCNHLIQSAVAVMMLVTLRTLITLMSLIELMTLMTLMRLRTLAMLMTLMTLMTLMMLDVHKRKSCTCSSRRKWGRVPRSPWVGFSIPMFLIIFNYSTIVHYLQLFNNRSLSPVIFGVLP